MGAGFGRMTLASSKVGAKKSLSLCGAEFLTSSTLSTGVTQASDPENTCRDGWTNYSFYISKNCSSKGIHTTPLILN